MRSTTTLVSGGSSPCSSPSRACTSCSATTMSLSGSNSTSISTAPRMVFERTRLTPRIGISPSSSGRVRLRSTISEVASGSVATTEMRGNESSG